MNLGEPTVSIVVCSVGRPDALELCIDGLSRLVDVAFEIVVVLGPGAESSTHRLRERPGIATIVRSPERNLSVLMRHAAHLSPSLMTMRTQKSAGSPTWFPHSPTQKSVL